MKISIVPIHNDNLDIKVRDSVLKYTLVCGTSGTNLKCRLAASPGGRRAAGNHMLRGESNRPLEVLRDLVLADVLGQVPDPQVPRLAHHPAVAAAAANGQARRRAVPPRLLTLASWRRAGEGATAAPPRGRRRGTSLLLDQSLS